MKLEDGTGFISSESDDTEGFQLETATANVTTGISNAILLEEGTQTDNSVNEVHGKTPILVRETVNLEPTDVSQNTHKASNGIDLGSSGLDLSNATGILQTELAIGGAMKSEEVSRGSLYSISENVIVNLPQSELGVGTSAKTLVGNIEDGSIEKDFS